jgi:hypothetical protein
MQQIELDLNCKTQMMELTMPFCAKIPRELKTK